MVWRYFNRIEELFNTERMGGPTKPMNGYKRKGYKGAINEEFTAFS